MLTVDPADADYPKALLLLPKPQPITLSRALPTGPRLAIVGTRRPCAEARAFAFELARAIALGGGVVVSGGAVGIDRAAHEGALAAGGRTVCVVGTGCGHVFPPAHAELYARVTTSEGAMLWPFPRDTPAKGGQFLRRNGVLAALSSLVVVVQAGLASGARNAAAWARRLGREVWVVPQAPWASKGFEGSLLELERGARPIASVERFLEAQALDAAAARAPSLFPSYESPGPTVLPGAPTGDRPPRLRLLAALARAPQHRDELAELAALSIAEVSTVLLTLTLENVVEEGPLGYFSLVGN